MLNYRKNRPKFDDEIDNIFIISPFLQLSTAGLALVSLPTALQIYMETRETFIRFIQAIHMETNKYSSSG